MSSAHAGNNTPNEEPKHASRAEGEAEGEDLKEFHCFQKLPIELRQKIWGMTTPPRGVVIQRISKSNELQYVFTRPVPAFLHACKESHMTSNQELTETKGAEYLDEDNADSQKSLARRKLEHPVYKLYFPSRKLRSGAFFDCNYDYFWGTYNESILTKHRTINRQNLYIPFVDLDITKAAKYLVLSDTFYDYSLQYAPVVFNKKLPHLKSLTVLLSSQSTICYDSQRGFITSLLKLPLEVNGEADIDGYAAKTQGPTAATNYAIHDLKNRRNTIRQRFVTAASIHPDWKLPVLKVRIRTQFMEVEGVAEAPLIFNAKLNKLLE